MSDQTDSLAKLANQHTPWEFAPEGIRCSCDRKNLYTTWLADWGTHLAEVIRAGFLNEYGVRDSRGIEVRGRMEARHLPGLASDWAEDGNPGELLARPVIPWHPIKENSQHD